MFAYICKVAPYLVTLNKLALQGEWQEKAAPHKPKWRMRRGILYVIGLCLFVLFFVLLVLAYETMGEKNVVPRDELLDVGDVDAL